MAKTFFVIQLRPGDETADSELRAIMKGSRLIPGAFVRIRSENTGLPDIDLDDYSGVIVGGSPFDGRLRIVLHHQHIRYDCPGL